MISRRWIVLWTLGQKEGTSLGSLHPPLLGLDTCLFPHLHLPAPYTLQMHYHIKKAVRSVVSGRSLHRQSLKHFLSWCSAAKILPFTEAPFLLYILTFPSLSDFFRWLQQGEGSSCCKRGCIRAEGLQQPCIFPLHPSQPPAILAVPFGASLHLV